MYVLLWHKYIYCIGKLALLEKLFKVSEIGKDWSEKQIEKFTHREEDFKDFSAEVRSLTVV